MAVYKGRTKTYLIREPKWRNAIVIFSQLAKAVSRFTTVDKQGKVEFDLSGIPNVCLEVGGLTGFMAEHMVEGMTEAEFNDLPAGEASGLMAQMIPMVFTPELLGNVARTVNGMTPAVVGASKTAARAGLSAPAS